jgi:hypothetical protein
MVHFATVSSGRYAPAVTPCSKARSGAAITCEDGERAGRGYFVVVRGCPLGPPRTAVNGTLVARPVRTTALQPAFVGTSGL